MQDRVMRIHYGEHSRRAGIARCDYVGNCFVAYRDILQAIRWDESLEMEEHWASDEALIINQLWHDRPDDIVFLPGDFNVSMLQNTDWAANPVMQSFIYHFIGQSKSRMDGARWQRTAPPELPHPWDKATQPIIDAFGTNPPTYYDLGQVVRAETAANLLAVYPELLVSGTWTTQSHYPWTRRPVRRQDSAW